MSRTGRSLRATQWSSDRDRGRPAGCRMPKIASWHCPLRPTSRGWPSQPLDEAGSIGPPECCASLAGLRKWSASNTNRQKLCSLCTGPFSANPTAQTKEGLISKSDEIDGGMFDYRAGRKRRLSQSVVVQKVVIVSQTAHPAHLTTRRRVKYGGPCARSPQDRGGCGVDNRVHHPLRRGREALRQAQSYGRAVVVRRALRFVFVFIFIVLNSILPLPPCAALNWLMCGLGSSVEGILKMVVSRGIHS